jgi:hypothetical protein
MLFPKVKKYLHNVTCAGTVKNCSLVMQAAFPVVSRIQRLR